MKGRPVTIRAGRAKMKSPMRIQHVALALLLGLFVEPAEPAACGESGVALQVLGSGGPIADDERAASGYLLWVDGTGRVLVDAGGGVFQRFGEAGGELEGLDLIALTHMHTDHASDLPALLKGAYFSERKRPLAITGPTGNDRFPGLEAFLDALFGAERGAYAYLSGLLDGGGGLFGLQPLAIDHDARGPRPVLEENGLKVEAIGVHHGPVPTLAYRLTVGGHRLVISGDQNLEGEGFVDFAHDADLLVMPFAIPEDAGPAARNLHALPSRIGWTAAEAGVEHLALSHFLARSLGNLDQQIEYVRVDFDGRLTPARDLLCLPLNE